jgi:hypothetical protein
MHYFSDDETLFCISLNDPDVAGLYVFLNKVDNNNVGMEWVDRVGHAISNSTHLRRLNISCSYSLILHFTMNCWHYFFGTLHTIGQLSI